MCCDKGKKYSKEKGILCSLLSRLADAVCLIRCTLLDILCVSSHHKVRRVLVTFFSGTIRPPLRLAHFQLSQGGNATQMRVTVGMPSMLTGHEKGQVCVRVSGIEETCVTAEFCTGHCLRSPPNANGEVRLHLHHAAPIHFSCSKKQSCAETAPKRRRKICGLMFKQCHSH